MDKSLRLAVSPHIHSGRSTAGIMRDVLIALLPAAVAGTVIFGLRSLLVIAICVLTCVLSEALYNIIVKKEQTVGDLSAAVTGLLLALNLFLAFSNSLLPEFQCLFERYQLFLPLFKCNYLRSRSHSHKRQQRVKKP